MAIVAGVDFGTLSVRASIFDDKRGRLGSATAEYPLLRKHEDPDHATQRHEDHMSALATALPQALEEAGVSGDSVEAVAFDTTGSSVIPLGQGLEPVGDYYLWCDHRAQSEASEITEAARSQSLPAIDWCGGVYSSEWGLAKVLHWLRHSGRAGEMVTAAEHCDYLVAKLSGVTDPELMPRSICAMGHKWMWHDGLGGLPSDEFLAGVDPAFAGVRAKLGGSYQTSDKIGGRLAPEWAERLGLRAGIPIPVGALDAHWDAIGAGIREGDVVNVVGTSTCMMAIAKQVDLIPGLCGVVNGSIHPDYFGIEAGLSAVGDIFDAIARRAGTTVGELSGEIEDYRAGQTGLLRMSWDSGDRTVLVNPELGGVTLGWNLTDTAADELFAAIEGTAFHTRIILERMEEYGVPVNRVINGGGIPQRNETLNRVYANVLNKPVLIPERESTSVGAAIFAFLAAGAFDSVEAAQDALCPGYRVVEPDAGEQAKYERLYGVYRQLYFELGRPSSNLGNVMPTLRALSRG